MCAHRVSHTHWVKKLESNTKDNSDEGVLAGMLLHDDTSTVTALETARDFICTNATATP
jgi:hypothetical protein